LLHEKRIDPTSRIRFLCWFWSVPSWGDFGCQKRIQKSRPSAEHGHKSSSS
jgi:hypothetical protein